MADRYPQVVRKRWWAAGLGALVVALIAGASGSFAYSAAHDLRRGDTSKAEHVLGFLDTSLNHGPVGAWSNSAFGLPVLRDFGHRVTLAQQLLPLANLLQRNGKAHDVLIGFVNPAEARPSGGLLGGFAVLRVKDGSFRVVESGPNEVLGKGELTSTRYSAIRYAFGSTATSWYDATLIPDYPTVAQVWAEQWRIRSGKRPEAVLSVDPHALAAIARDDAIAEYLLHGQYLVSAKVRAKKDRQLVSSFDASLLGARGLWSMLGMLQQQRVRLWGTTPGIRAAADSAGVNGALGSGPLLYLVNSAGNKLDAFVRSEVQQEVLRCTPTTLLRRVEVRVTLALDSATALPGYVNRRSDLGLKTGLGNSHHVTAVLIAPKGARIVRTLLPSTTSTREARAIAWRGRPSAATRILLSPRETFTVGWVLSEPRSGAAALSTPPTANDPAQSLTPDCPN